MSGLRTVIPGSDLITSFARQGTISKDAKKRLAGLKSQIP